MKKNKPQREDEMNFWQPASDMFSALLLILMLVILLLGLYLVHIPEDDQPDPFPGDSFATPAGGDAAGTETPRPTVFIWAPDWDGGGGGATPWNWEPTPSASPSPTVSPTPDLPGGGGGGGGGGEGGGNGQGEGPGDEPDAGLKSAVYVMIVDAETDRTIKEAGVEFELYGDNHSLQVLNTYYPERLSFRFYDTTEAGTFYFPEKLPIGAYTLHALTEPEGYDPAENLTFLLDQTYDWADPYVVRVPIYPARNVIRVQMTDAETGMPVSGGAFDVIANEDIFTADGTLRCRTGQVVGEIACDETGYGVSEELYLGNYLIRQKEIPAYYAALTETIEAAVEKKSQVEPPVNTVASERTKIHVTLTDELYAGRGISGASFVLSAGNGVSPVELTTDYAGRLTLDEVEKGVTYRIHQASSGENYRPLASDLTVSVTADGRIGGEAEASLEVVNRMIRAAIGITDEFSAVQIPNVNLALYDSGDTLIRTWTTTGSALNFNGLQVGDYYLIMDGDAENRYPIHVSDQAEIQTFNLHTSYVLHYLLYAGIALLALAAGIVIWLLRRRKKKKHV